MIFQRVCFVHLSYVHRSESHVTNCHVHYISARYLLQLLLNNDSFFDSLSNQMLKSNNGFVGMDMYFVVRILYNARECLISFYVQIVE